MVNDEECEFVVGEGKRCETSGMVQDLQLCGFLKTKYLGILVCTQTETSDHRWLLSGWSSLMESDWRLLVAYGWKPTLEITH